ncbi:MAG: aldo/keto reductase [Chloroflexota bacterium]
MIKRINLSPEFSISRSLTGLWQIADMERDGRSLDLDQAAASMAPYFEAGYTTFDMADHYGSAEIIAGRFRRSLPEEMRNQLQLFTKWVPKPGPLTREEVREAVQTSLDRLQVEHLDLLQYHAWNYADPSWLDGIFYLDELRQEGLIRHLGMTNVDTPHLNMLVKSGVPIASNQVCYSLLDRRASGPMTALCQNEGISILAFGTVAGGFLTEKWLGKPEPDWEQLETWSQMKYGRYIREAGGWKAFQHLLQAIKTAADHHQVSMANIACRYILEQPAVAGVIIGARLGQSEHIADNARLFEFELDTMSRGEIEGALDELDIIPGDCGDEYRKPPFLTASGDLSHHLERFPVPYEVVEGNDGRMKALSGTVWEDLAGYCRAVRRGDRIWVSGTTATHGKLLIGGEDPAAQLHFIIDKIEGALHSLGGKLEDVVQSRLYIKNMPDWEPVARVHGERMGHIQPANTLVQANLVGEAYLVEMEVEAVVT